MRDETVAAVRRGVRDAASSGARGDGAVSSFDPVEVTDATLPRVLAEAGEKPVLVDCWAEWCPPCRMLAPTIEALAAGSAGRWVIAKLDTEQNPRTASQFHINSIPTMLIFKKGELVDQLVGLQPRPAIEARSARGSRKREFKWAT